MSSSKTTGVVSLSYSEGTKALPHDAPEWAVTASQRIQSRGTRLVAKPPDGVKRVLLHSCCAPCSGAMVEEMMCAAQNENNELEEVVVFFYNPNIHPRKEYEIRKVGNVTSR